MAPFSDIQLSRIDWLEGRCVPAKPYPKPRAVGAMLWPCLVRGSRVPLAAIAIFFPFDLDQE